MEFFQRKRLRWHVVILALFTFIFCSILAFDVAPALRGVVPWLANGQGWEWLYRLPRPFWLALLTLSLFLYCAGALPLVRRASARRLPVRLILWAFCGAVLLSFLTTALEGPVFAVSVQRTLSKVMGAYPRLAVHIDDLAQALRTWPTFTAAYQANANVPPGGVVLDPPGLTILYDTAMRLLDVFPGLAASMAAPVRAEVCQDFDLLRWRDAQIGSVWLQTLMPLWSALAVAPLYTLGRQIFGPRSARWAVAFYPLVPGLLHFAPRFNTLYPAITLVMLTFLWRGIVHHRVLFIFVSGFVLSVGTFLNLSLVPLGLLAGLFLAAEGMAARRSFGTFCGAMVSLGAGAASVWVLYGPVTGVMPWDILSASMSLHLQMDRPYLPWLVMHPYDMFLFVGLPAAVLSIVRIVRARRAAQPADRLALVSAISLLILVLSGTARGETGRVWLFLAPIWILLGADALQRWTSRERTLTLGLQAFTALIMAAFIQPYLTGLTSPALPSLPQAPPMYPYDAQFAHGDDRLTLLGVSLEPSPAQVTLHLQWRADRPIRGPYAMSLARLAPDGSLLDTLTWIPYAGNYPPSCWTPGQPFSETVIIPLDTAKPGPWLFSLSIVDVFTSEPMTATTSDGLMSEQIGIGPIEIPAASASSVVAERALH